MLELGVRLEDRGDDSIWKLEDPAVLRREQQAKQQAAAEQKHKKAAMAHSMKQAVGSAVVRHSHHLGLGCCACCKAQCGLTGPVQVTKTLFHPSAHRVSIASPPPLAWPCLCYIYPPPPPPSATNVLDPLSPLWLLVTGHCTLLSCLTLK